MQSLILDIRKVQDRTGQEVQVKYCDFIAQGPKDLMRLFYDTSSEMITSGFSESAIVIHNKCKSVYVEIDHKVVGHIIFDVHPNLRRGWIVLSAVDPAYRKRGLYKIMHTAFEEACRKLDLVEIASYVHINNVTRQTSAKSVDFLPTHYLMRKRIDK